MTDDSYLCPNCGGDTSQRADVRICMECSWDSTTGITETDDSDRQVTKRDLFEKCVDEHIELLTKLESLADSWADTAAMKHPAENRPFNARCDAWRKASKELQELITEHRSTIDD